MALVALTFYLTLHTWNAQLTRLSYTDFLVNEIRKDGEVLHLRDFEENEPPVQVCAIPDHEISFVLPICAIQSR